LPSTGWNAPPITDKSRTGSLPPTHHADRHVATAVEAIHRVGEGGGKRMIFGDRHRQP
jgi:hypothetical protein